MIRLSILLIALSAPLVRAETPRVVADIAPVHSLVAQVMEGVGTPDLLIRQGASPHAHALRPSEAQALSRADVVIWIGPELTPSLPDQIANLGPDARALALIEDPGTERLTVRDMAVFGENETHAHEANHDDEHAHGHDDDGDEHGHGHEGVDPHAWLDPHNASAWLGVIAEVLAGVDTDNADRYRANAKAAQADLTALESEIYRTLDSANDGDHIVFHDAFQYFERRFGISAAGAIALSDASDPSPARIAALRERIADEAVTCVLSEPQFDTGLVDTVLEGSGAKRAVIDPLGTALELGPTLYPALLRDMAATLADCR